MLRWRRTPQHTGAEWTADVPGRRTEKRKRKGKRRSVGAGAGGREDIVCSGKLCETHRTFPRLEVPDQPPDVEPVAWDTGR